MEKEKINYFDTPNQRRQNGNWYQDVLNRLLGFQTQEKDEDLIVEDKKEHYES